MEYQFGFDKRQIQIVTGGLMVCTLLTFAAGFMTALAVQTPEGSALLKAACQTAAEQATQQAKAAAEQAAEKLGSKIPTLSSTATSAVPAVAPASSAAATPVPVPVRAAVVAVAPPLAALTATPENDKPIAAEDDVYSLQLGTFADPKAARELQAALREKGYRASIFSAVDLDHKEWHAVRIGGFPSLTAASTAASAFTQKERIQALVRRSNAL